MGQIIGDIFFINPIDNEVWSAENSRIIQGTGKSIKLPSSFKILVEATSVWELPGVINEVFQSREVSLDSDNSALNKIMNRRPMLSKEESHLPITDRLKALDPKERKKKNKELTQIQILEANCQ